jgi:uncharacterized membrane protein
VALGTWFRFSHLQTKYYFYDEVYSALHAAGYTVAELSAYDPQRSITAGEFVQIFQMPGAERGPADTVRVLAITDASHPPLYYLLERGMEEALGDSIAARRTLAAVAGLLLLPAVFWFCIELFGTALAGWLTLAVVALSPYQVVFSQQVREWTLFELLAVLTAALMLRALRGDRTLPWVAYAIALVLMLYSAILSVFALLGLSLFVLLRSASYGRRSVRAFWIASCVGFAAFVPWLASLALHWREATRTNQWAAAALPLKLYVAKLAFTASAVFFDAEYLNVRLAGVLPFVALAAGFAVWLFVRDAQRDGKSLVFCLFGTTAAGFVLTDAVLRASRAAQPRYLVLASLAAEIGVACGLALGLAEGSRRTRAAASLAVILLAEAASTAVGCVQRSWWSNNEAAEVSIAAQRLGPERDIVVLTNPFAGLQLADALPPNAFLAFDLASALHSGQPVLYAFDPNPESLAALRASEGGPGEPIELVAPEQQALRSFHRSVAAAHGLTAATAHSLWRFANRLH